MNRYWKYDGEYWVITQKMWTHYGNETRKVPPCPICKEVVSEGDDWIEIQKNDIWIKEHPCKTKLKFMANL
jgi:hypothetical protein